jgi:DNA-binding beta-propeller fold protein YncE
MPRPTDRAGLRWTLLLLLILMSLDGCAGRGLEWLEEPSPEGPVWPAPPAAPRIQYLGSIAGARAAGLGGGFLHRMASTLLGAGEKALVRPTAVAVSPDGAHLVITDPGIPAVHVLSPEARRWRVIRSDRHLTLRSPVGVSVDREGRFWVTDSGTGRLLLLDGPEGDLQEVDPPGALHQPVGIAVMDDGRVVVSDTHLHQLVWFTPQGGLIGYEGRRGEGPGQLNFPTMLSPAPGGRLLVTDSLNFRVQVRSPDGSWPRQIGSLGDASGHLARPKGVALDRHGNLYVVEGYYGNLSIFDLASGGFNLSIGGIGPAPGEFRLPVGVWVDARDRIFVADSQNGRVQVFKCLEED